MGHISKGRKPASHARASQRHSTQMTSRYTMQAPLKAAPHACMLAWAFPPFLLHHACSPPRSPPPHRHTLEHMPVQPQACPQQPQAHHSALLYPLEHGQAAKARGGKEPRHFSCCCSQSDRTSVEAKYQPGSHNLTPPTRCGLGQQDRCELGGSSSGLVCH